MDKKSSESKPLKRSVKSYATRVFQESTIGIVASIASSHSNARRLFKSLVLILCITGFSYHCTTFLIHVFQYPTTVDIDIRKPEFFNSPAVTFCSSNGIKRSDFCSKFPLKCYQPSEEFCSKYYDYCGKNSSTLVPKKEYYFLEKSLTYEEILKLGIDDKSELLPLDKNMFYNDTKGPYMRTKHGTRGTMLCYTLHSVVDTAEKPRQLKRDDVFASRKAASTDLTFYVRQDEMFIPGNRAGMLFSIHSPYEAVNPFDKGIFLKPGRNYRIYVSMLEEVLLKDPFTTDCIDYVEEWEANNRTGPRIQEMCQEKCLLEGYLGCYNCVGVEVLYPTTEKFCNSDDYNTSCPDGVFDKFLKCLKNCKDDCNVTSYTPVVLERYEVDYEEKEILEHFERYIAVDIIVETGEIMTFKHSPKYLTVEVFSSIGGFIGCWLGICLMDIIDVLVSVFSVSRYSLRKYRKQ